MDAVPGGRPAGDAPADDAAPASLVVATVEPLIAATMGGRGPASRTRFDPHRPGVVPVQGRPGPGPLRRQGDEPAQPALELLRPARVVDAAHAADGRGGVDGRVD